ncbi:hypothetical protein [Mycobacterium botniense]|uniref:Low molecular weight antigen MTB12 n=1 Tax=Mycobacterium botniense TaxID=84962 RepID=A0A7I9Y1R6_9MYCO|nr:hypothetical protein [Mycobacterium botniense]GFG76018.1 low molecular weight antigen MTB12 [Mycobacterium botniense]
MTVKSLATGVAAAAAVGAAAAGVTSGAPVTAAAPQIEPVVFTTPLPLDPAADLPTPEQLANVLYGLANPSVSFASKGYLVEGGIGPVEARIADRQMQKAAQRGDLPLSFAVANIAPAGPGAATAAVTASGPNLAPTTQTVTFVNQGGWKLSRASAMSVLQAVQASG